MTPVSKTKLVVPMRDPDSHKGQNGLVLVTGGSIDYVGAPALAGLAALRAGCDIVNIAAPEKAALAINRLSPDLITTKLKGDYITKAHAAAILKLAKRFDAVLIGNGMSKKDKDFVSELVRGLARAGIPAVIDADAVKVARISDLKNTIITPHRKEFELFLEENKETLLKDELTDKKLAASDAIALIQNQLSQFFVQGNVLLLKGRQDLIISRNKSMIVKGGNAGMTVGGTGDVLAGLCVGYLAQTADLFMSAVLASRNCKRIGDLLRRRSNFGFGFIASDFLKEIKKLKKLR